MFRLLSVTIIFVLFITNAFGVPVDSIGVEKRNGKVLVQYKVEKGETLYSILKRYDCPENDFYAVNNTFKKGDIITPEQIIEVPIKTKIAKTKSPDVEIFSISETNPKKNIDENGIEIVDVPEATPKELRPTEKVSKTDSPKESVLKAKTGATKMPLKGKTHTVLAGQNLFTIAKLYKLKIGQIQEWNNLTSDAVRINQVLLIEKPSVSIVKVPKKDTLKPKMPQVQAPAGDVEKEKPKDEAVINKSVKNKPTTTVPNAPGGKKFSEKGIAEIIEAGVSTNKFLALHRTAPVGTLIKVANQANGQSVWVKVIGKLNGSGDVVIKVSPKAFEKLSPRDKRISAELSYSVSN